METHGMTVIEQNTMEAIQRLNQKAPDIHPLSLRDLFAMSALSGLIQYNQPVGGMNTYAELAYSFADAMMTVRSRGGKNA